MNVVMTGDGKFVEVQGTAEGAPFDRAELDALLALAEERLRRPDPPAVGGAVPVTAGAPGSSSPRATARSSRRCARILARAPARRRGARHRRRRGVRRAGRGPADVRGQRAAQGPRRPRRHRAAVARRRQRPVRRRPQRDARRALGALGRRRPKDDDRNNELLLDQLADVPDERRGAHFTCAVAFCATPGAMEVVEGRMAGRVIREKRGERRLRLRRAVRGRRARGRRARHHRRARPRRARTPSPTAAGPCARSHHGWLPSWAPRRRRREAALPAAPHAGAAPPARRALARRRRLPPPGHPGRRPAHVQLGLGADDAARLDQRRADQPAGQEGVLPRAAGAGCCGHRRRPPRPGEPGRHDPDAPGAGRRRATAFLLGIAAEGTRSKGEYWKGGFYRIAQQTGLPITLAFVDGPSRTVGLRPDVRRQRGRRRRHGPGPRVLRRQARPPARAGAASRGCARRAEVAGRHPIRAPWRSPRLTSREMCARRDSNSHWPRPKRGASANWATGARARLRRRRDRGPCAAWRRGRWP